MQGKTHVQRMKGLGIRCCKGMDALGENIQEEAGNVGRVIRPVDGQGRGRKRVRLLVCSS